MDFFGCIVRLKTIRPTCRRKHLSRHLLDTLVVSASLIIYIHVTINTSSHPFVHGTSFEPTSWRITSLAGHPDNLIINDFDGSIFLPINGDIYKYSSNLSLVISTASQSTSTIIPANATSQYKSKILKILRYNNSDLLLSCWQNPYRVLKCVFYRLNDLKFVPLVLYVANDNVTAFKTDTDEELRAISSSHDINNLLIVTSRLQEKSRDYKNEPHDNDKSFMESFRDLPVMGQFRIAKNQISKQFDMQLTTVLPIRANIKKFKIFYDYIYMFNYEDYTYFVMNDVRSFNSDSGDKDIIHYVRLARICRNDTALTSYTEISITCSNQDDAYAKVAYLDIAKSMHEQNLYIITERYSSDNHRKTTSMRSYLCSYSMRLIQDIFHKAVSDCHGGFLSATLLDKLHPETDQVPICQKNPSRDWCSSATNPYIDGSNYHVKEDTSIQLDGLTAVNFFYVIQQGKSNLKDVYFVGTESGLLTKIGSDEELFYTIDLHSRTVKNFLIEGEKLSSIHSNDSVISRKGTEYASWGHNIYAITGGSEIHHLNISGCQFYTSCHACTTNRDPLACVWCEDSCTAKDDCDINRQSTSSCPPIIKSFTPISGPLTGNTRLSIYGESFGSDKGDLKVHVANQECKIDRKVSDNDKIECILNPVDKTLSSLITINVSDDSGVIALKGVTNSRLPYTYKKVLVAGNTPAFVPVNGSSEVTILGDNLDVGAYRKVLFSDVECSVTKVEEKQLKCLIRPADQDSYVDHQNLKGILRLIIDGRDQEHYGPSIPNPFGNISNTLEFLEVDNMVDPPLDGMTQHDESVFSSGNLFLILAFLVLLTVLIIYLTRYEGFSQIRVKMLPKSFRDKSDLEAAKMSLRNDVNNTNMHSDLRGRPSESFSGLIKLNDLTSDYFSKSDQIEQDKPLMHDLVDDEMMSILKQEKILIERNRLTLGHVLGSGQFGRVYKGFLKIENSGEHATVAVKTLHNRCHWDDSDNNQAFLEEGLMMKDFAHENVLALIGVTFDSNGLPMVITPFMLYGDLRSYISDEASSPTVKELIEYGIQVAKGMAYLSSLKFVHRDLAARNCMLDENLVVKVADFGLSRDIYERDYYSSDNKKAKLPVKWMAIESLEKSVYSTKTDVWSYGILLWELMTRGVVPYPDVDNFDLFSYLKEGRRMLRPRYCPVNLYRIMQACWSANPEDRPSFEELVTSVSNVITQLQEAKDNSCGQQKVSRDETYCDVVS